MKRVLISIMLLVTMLLFACGSSEPGEHVGKWLPYSASSWGEEIAIDEVFEEGFYVELLSGGKALFINERAQEEGTWKLNKEALVVEGKDFLVKGVLEGGKIVLQDVNAPGVNVIMLKEGTFTPPTPSVSEDPPVPEIPADEPPVTPSTTLKARIKEVTPVTPSPEDSDPELPSHERHIFEYDTFWIGWIDVVPIAGDFDYPLWMEVFGYMGIDESTGRGFFEIYPVEEIDEVYFSMYIDIVDPYHFVAEIGEDDAWILGRMIEPEEAELFDGHLVKDVLYYDYTYVLDDIQAQVLIGVYRFNEEE